MKYLVVLFLIVAVHVVSTTAHAQTSYRHFSSHICSYSISYPASWHVISKATQHEDTFKAPTGRILEATVGCLPTGGVLTLKKILTFYRGSIQRTGFTLSPVHTKHGVATFTATKNALHLAGQTYAAKIGVTMAVDASRLLVLTFTDEQSHWNSDVTVYGHMRSTWSAIKGK
ncbi:MAG: hypothetical protein PVSMB7_29580 [Chloroflexota bacterium]